MVSVEVNVKKPVMNYLTLRKCGCNVKHTINVTPAVFNVNFS